MELAELKPILTALVLPPAGPLLLALLGVLVGTRRRLAGAIVVLAGVALLWFLSCNAVAVGLARNLLPQVEPIARAQLDSVQAIVVLGGGVEPFAPEYGVSMLSAYSLERLLFGNWLSRETGVPVAFSGGPGWAQRQSTSEAEVAARIAAQELGRPLKWTEDQSRDTHENAARTIPLMKRAGVTHILLVTHGWHMPRAKRAFDELAAPNGIRIEAAPMGLGSRAEGQALDWLPTTLGTMRTRDALREWLGRLLGA